MGGLTWRYTPVRDGIKAEAAVQVPQGPRRYRFPYRLVAGTDDFAIDADGNAVIANVLKVPRVSVFGADGTVYDGGPWVVRTGTDWSALEFSFDDSPLPAAAYPYRIDPTTAVPNSTDGGYVYGRSYVYTTARGTAYTATTGTLARVGQLLDVNTYSVYRGFLEFDTSSLPADATVNQATLSLNTSAPNGLTVQIRQYDWAETLLSNREANFDGCLATEPAVGTWDITTATVSGSLPATWVKKGGTASTRYCLVSARDAQGAAPTGAEYVDFTDATLTLDYAPPSTVEWFDGGETGSNSAGINTTGSDCLGYSATNCATGAQCFWSNTPVRSGALALRFEAGSNGQQFPSVDAPVGTQGCGPDSAAPCWLQACFYVPGLLTLPATPARIAIYQSASSPTSGLYPSIRLQEGRATPSASTGSGGPGARCWPISPRLICRRIPGTARSSAFGTRTAGAATATSSCGWTACGRGPRTRWVARPSRAAAPSATASSTL